MVTRLILVAGLLATVSFAQASPVATSGTPVMAGWTLTSGSVNVLGAVSNAAAMPGLASWALHTQLGGASGASALLYSPSVRASYAQIVSTPGLVAPVAPQLAAGVPLNVLSGGSSGNVVAGSGRFGGGVGGAGGSAGASGSGTAGGDLPASGSFQPSGGSQSGSGAGGAEGSGNWSASQPSSGGSGIEVTGERGGSHGGSDAGGDSDLNVLPAGLIQELNSASPIQQLVSFDLVAAQEVPEPDSDILLLAGLCAAGLLLRRRK